LGRINPIGRRAADEAVKLVPAVVSNCEIASLEGFGDRRIQGQAQSELQIQRSTLET